MQFQFPLIEPRWIGRGLGAGDTIRPVRVHRILDLTGVGPDGQYLGRAPTMDVIGYQRTQCVSLYEKEA